MFAVITVLLAALGILISLTEHGYLIRFTTGLMMWIALSQSLNTITGYVGRVDFGHVMFFGIGAYTTAYLILKGFPWYLSIVISIIVVLLFSVIIGYPTLRLYGAYFAIATWSFAEATKQIFMSWKEVGASIGLSLPSILSSQSVLQLMTLAALTGLLINFLIERGRLGLAFNSIRNNEVVASTAGINVVYYRVLAYALSSIAASMAGSTYALWISYVYPGDVFHGLKTDQMFVMMLLGGAGSYAGVLIGSIVVTVAYEILWTLFSEQLYIVFLGLLIVLIVLFMPNGIAYYLGLKSVSARRLLTSLFPIPITKSVNWGKAWNSGTHETLR